ncbi:MAG: hypothetical protein NVS3B17_07960 [Vulcanimicrobiaceae bacterium]
MTSSDREQDRHFRQLFEHAAIGMNFVALDGKFINTNERFDSIVEYGSDELRTMTCVDLTHPDDRAFESDITSDMLTGAYRARTWEKRYLRRSGEPVWCNLTLTLLTDDLGAPTQFVGVVEDITERRAAVQRLNDSESLLRSAAQVAGVAGWTFDYVTREIALSSEACALFAIPPGWKATLDSLASVLSPESRERLRAGIERNHRLGDALDFELEIVRPGGERRWVHAIAQSDPRRERLVGAIKDITAPKAAEIEMLRMNRALKMLSGCNEVLIRAGDEQQLLRDVTQLIVDNGGYRMVWVGYAREDERRSVEAMAVAGLHEGYFEKLRFSWDEDDAAGRGPAGHVIRTGERVVVGDFATDERCAPWRDAAAERGYRGFVVLPLRDGARTFGVLGLYSSEALAPPPAEIALLQQLADDISFGIAHLRSRAEQQRTQEAIGKISAAVSARGGTDFLEGLVGNMADAVGAQAAFVVRDHPTDPTKLRTIVGVIDGQNIPTVEFPRAGSPCDDVGDDFFIVATGLGERYSNCAVNAVVGANALVGARICDSNDATLAVTMILFRAPLVDLELLKASLKIFVARAAAELERRASFARIADQASWLDRARDAIVVHDVSGTSPFWNQGAERLYGWSARQACGSLLEDLLATDRDRLREATASVVESGFWNGEVDVSRKDGSSGWIESRWTMLGGEDGAPRSILSIDTDITQRKTSEREIEHLAFYDVLTNLPNRLLLVQRLKRSLLSCAGHGSLLFLDLDNFKSLNDTLGHDKGDVLLQRVAQRLRGCIRSGDIVARFGGDEFVVMLDELGSTPEIARSRAQTVADAILASFVAPYELDGYVHSSTASIGVALYARADNADELLKQADLAMYCAKAAGRNAVRFFAPEMQTTVELRRALEDDIRLALAAREYTVVYQPQIDVGGAIVGAEALVRWSHVRRGNVSPAEFIPVAEDSGLIVPLGRFVLETACKQLVAWTASPATAGLKMSVNVSAHEFRTSDFVGRTIEIVRATGADPRSLVLELTESVLADDIDVMIAKMSALRTIGVGFSLDDFGTGYSSLSYLKRLPLNQLKIDQSFVRDVLLDHNDAVIARTIVALGQSLSLDVIAEGVETSEQRRFLASVGCRSFQGYYFSRPISAAAFAAFASKHSTQTKYGLLDRSRPMVVEGPWPGTTIAESS